MRTVDPSRVPPGQYVTHDFPVLSAGPTPRAHLDDWSFTIDGAVESAVSWSWPELMALPARDRHQGHPLRHQVVQARHHLARRVRRHAAGRTSTTEAAYLTAWSDGGYTTNLPLADVRGGQGVGRLRVRRAPAGARARRPGTAARAAPLFLEERQVGARPRAHRRRRARLLGGLRLQQLRRSMARAALPGRLTWQLARGGRRRRPRRAQTQDASCSTLPDWSGTRGPARGRPPHRRGRLPGRSAATRSPRRPRTSTSCSPSSGSMTARCRPT